MKHYPEGAGDTRHADAQSQHRNARPSRDEGRIQRDLKTLQAIGSIYCGAHHHDRLKDEAGMCEGCAAAIKFTHDRASACPYGHESNCQDCSLKCNRGEQQQRIKAIMKYAAPRMLFRHPIMTMEYLSKKMKR